jgi:hypothetical protein
MGEQHMKTDREIRAELKKLGRILIVGLERAERLGKVCKRANELREKYKDKKTPAAMNRKVAQAFNLKNNIDEKLKKQWAVIGALSVDLVNEAKKRRK